jgi:uncharacterized membrane protein YccC
MAMYVVLAVAMGVAVGFARSGRFSNLGERRFRSAWLLLIGVVLQAATEIFHLPKTPDVVAVLVSYAALALFAARNLRLAGMGVVAIGLVLNIIPIAVNEGMPVRASAVVESGITANRAGIAGLRFGGKRHLATPADHLMVLGDILPDPLFHEVLSFGDLAMAVGIAAVVANLLLPTRRRRQSPARPKTKASGGDLRSPSAAGDVALSASAGR